MESDKHTKVPGNKISSGLKDTTRNHILKFSSVESFYNTESSFKKYLDNSLSETKMYKRC